MTHDELQEKLRKAMGGKIPMSARDSWAEFLRSKATEFRLLYDWIVVKGFYTWILEDSRVDFGEGVEGVTVFIVEFGRVDH